MSIEEAIKYLQWARPIKPYSFDKKGVQEAIDMAIKALEENEKLKAEVEKWKSYFEQEIENEC